MYTIKDAKIRRFTDIDGVRCAEIEVNSASVEDTGLLVYLAPSDGGDGYKMLRMLRNDADLELDWYDNNLHSAFEEVTDVVFSDNDGKDLPEKRGRFTRELLSHGKMDSELAAEFGK
ncbi:hypothetical protein [Paenibacillus medicaginis]|uniref:Uncharacterized protein n=1 Tax=Paenibacillus medicaginis TaxID=1470560 RepID=A0ABV5C2K4_9BACL